MVLSIKERFPIGKLYVTKRSVRVSDEGPTSTEVKIAWLDEGVLLMLLDITPIKFNALHPSFPEYGHCFKLLDGKKIIYANFLDDQPPMFIERLYESV